MKEIEKLNLSTKNIAILASGSGTNAQAIIEACESGEINGSVKIIVSNNKKAYVLERGKKHGIETMVELDFLKIEEKFKALEIDLIVLAGYLKILPLEFIGSFENRIINIHPSLLPAFCGKDYYGERVHKAAIDRGVKYSGATTHFVNEIPDGGPIIFQEVVEVRQEDDYKSLGARVLTYEHPLLVKTCKYFCGELLKVEGLKVSLKEEKCER